MADNKVARLSYATIYFTPQGETEPLTLGYQQTVTLSRSSETKELLSNDNQIGEQVATAEINVKYTFKTEIGDLSIPVLSQCFAGTIVEKTYKVGDTFKGKTIKATTGTLAIGDVVLKDDRIYIITKAGNFAPENCAPKSFGTKSKSINPETRPNTYGKIYVEGVNVIDGNHMLLDIPSVNLKFSGDLPISGGDIAKLSLEGEVMKKEDEELFTFEEVEK